MTRYDALRGELEALATEAAEPRYAELDRLPLARQLEMLADASADAVEAVRAASTVIARAVEEIVPRLRRGGRLIYVGAGTAGRMGVLDASEIPPTFGTDPALVLGIIAGGDTALRSAVENAEDDASAGAAALDAQHVGSEDTVVGISASGRTPYVRGALDRARELGALAISLACNTGAAISHAADIAIEIDTGPEVIAGSTRLKAGTAQKLALNALSSLTMVGLGKVHGNLMVDVQATNEKLRARAERIVMRATGLDAARAAEALAFADGSVKLAIVLVESGASVARAREALDESDGVLRRALDLLSPPSNEEHATP